MRIARGLGVLGLLLALSSAAATAHVYTDVRGVVTGTYSTCSLISDQESVSLKLVGSFFFGGVPYRGPLSLYASTGGCSGSGATSAPFHGSNPANGKRVSGTCYVSYSTTPSLFTAHLDCTGRVISATAVGPYGKQKLGVTAVRSNVVDLVQALGCGLCDNTYDEHYYEINGLFFREQG